MKRIDSFDEWSEIVKDQNPFLLFVKTDNCSVCDGLYPQVAALHTDYPMSFYMVNVSRTPEFAGQLSLFSAPVVLLMSEGREYARLARFVRMDELKRRMRELLERGEFID